MTATKPIPVEMIIINKIYNLRTMKIEIEIVHNLSYFVV